MLKELFAILVAIGFLLIGVIVYSCNQVSSENIFYISLDNGAHECCLVGGNTYTVESINPCTYKWQDIDSGGDKKRVCVYCGYAK